MRVKWTVSRPYFKVPEYYWNEDLSLLDKTHEGEVIDTINDFWGLGETYFLVQCFDNKVRKINIDKVTVI